MFCSILIASWICFQPAPIICQIYEKEIKTASFTAYTLSPEETDSSPTIGAWGDDLSKQGKECIVATRLYPRNTIIYIEGLQRKCKVLDKTGKKYADRIDILFPDRKSALQFGIKKLNYQVIK